jgi:transmembrane sensor
MEAERSVDIDPTTAGPERTSPSDDPFAAFAPLERESYDLLFRFVSRTADASDLRALQQWSAQSPAHRDAFARACRTWEALAPAAAMIGTAAAPSRRVSRRIVVGGALAASAAAASVMLIRPPLGLWPSWSELNADYRTSVGEQRTVALGDHASIELNTRTSVTIQQPTGQTGRIELISGEASIAIKPAAARLVEVVAMDGRASASDAVFNIRVRADGVCTTCVSGQVAVERGDSRAVLVAGQQIEYGPGRFGPMTPTDPATTTAWRDGVIVFHATPLAEVVEEINRYRLGRIILVNQALKQRVFSARFRIENVEAAVAQIERVFGAKATRLPGGVVLIG